jgi:hypothetical protein
MSSNVNRADVQVSLRDVHGRPIKDDVEIIFKNMQVGSLSQSFDLKLDGTQGPIVIPGVPAFPTGRAQVIIKPNKYRSKSFLIHVIGGAQNAINEIFFVDSAKARPKLMDFKDLASKPYGSELLRILKASGIGQTAWDALDKRSRATILNLSAKMFRETTKDGRALISQVQNIDQELLTRKNRARIFSNTEAGLLPALRKFPERFKGVSGVLHKFSGGFNPVGQDNSFKSRDDAGNIQLTFGTNADGAFLADIDLDDHAGLQHAADVLKHRFSGDDTDPYDIHEILIHFQSHLGVDPGYDLL